MNINKSFLIFLILFMGQNAFAQHNKYNFAKSSVIIIKTIKNKMIRGYIYDVNDTSVVLTDRKNAKEDRPSRVIFADSIKHFRIRKNGSTGTGIALALGAEVTIVGFGIANSDDGLTKIALFLSGAIVSPVVALLGGIAGSNSGKTNYIKGDREKFKSAYEELLKYKLVLTPAK